jgi:HEAT repeat-containing protein 5
MLRIATATAWAELDISSSERSYLKEVVEPYRQVLSSLWVASLRDYASIRGDSEMLQDGSSAILDSSFVALGREVLLPVSRNSFC